LQPVIKGAQDVATDDNLKLVERAIGGKIVLGKNDVLFQRGIGKYAPAFFLEVVRECTLAASLPIINGKLVHRGCSEAPSARVLYCIFAHIGGIQTDALIDLLFLQENGQRIDFFSSRAPRMPNPCEWICSQKGHHFLSEGIVESGIREHRKAGGRERPNEPLQERRIAQNFLLESGYGRNPGGKHALTNPAPHGAPLVVPEIIAVVT